MSDETQKDIDNRELIMHVRELPKPTQFRYEIKFLLNKMSMESDSDTPDFILAEFLSQCLSAFNEAVVSRTNWYSKK